MDPSVKLMPNKGMAVSQLEYSQAIGCLMYAMTSTRPDIAYAVGRLSRYTSNPSTQHWQAIQRVFKYLKGTMDYGLYYLGYPSVLEGYSDASWITHVEEDHSSTTGWVFLLGGGAISWASKKQTCITNSTMESEFVALAAAGKEAEWLRNLIYEIPLWSKPIAPISIHCDSAATLAKAYNQVYNGKSRHLGVRHSMIRDLIMNGVISVEFVKSQQNLADHLTKSLARDLVHKSIQNHGVSILLSNLLKGILPSYKIPNFSFLKPATIGIPTSQMFLAPFHSNSASNCQSSPFHHRRSMFETITKLDDALQLFDQMTQTQPLLPSVVKFNQLLLTVVAKMKHYSCSIHLFKQMASIGAPIDVWTTNIVIKCCCQQCCTSEGFAIVACGFKRGVVPDVCTFNTLLNGFILEDRVHEAERLFKKLIKWKLCIPNVVMYNTMIKGLCKLGINDTAIALLKLMNERGCKPDVMTYNTIIDSLCKDEMVHDALKLFNVMILHKGILPDVVTYNSLIRGLCNSGRWDDASKMLREMEEEKISPNVITYNILVDALCKEGMGKMQRLF
ncbi:hypothetical protein OSB04_011363 [Centaurea solstitialis]|uniref:Pentatricopeptide repeat-containing protein n=1 Tax=Centaurea solstitialis TaxID=347529 RepID=A0AA38TB08_9ASTR|nr:hypothetical protein OSB04_011363 [Centaurea solstitialis]